jgi:predicted N-acetyltransferase YhbS
MRRIDRIQQRRIDTELPHPGCGNDDLRSRTRPLSAAITAGTELRLDTSGRQDGRGLVATHDGRPVGSNFLDERGSIAAIGPVTVDPALQDGNIGRALMQAVLDRAEERGFAGVRLVQAGYHCRSLALYLKLGFEAREHLSCLQGSAIGKPSRAVRITQTLTLMSIGLYNDPQGVWLACDCRR